MSIQVSLCVKSTYPRYDLKKKKKKFLSLKVYLTVLF